MFYARLHTKDPFLDFINKEEGESLHDVAEKFINRKPEDPTLFIETVSPQGFHGLYGFLMDDEAMQYQPEVNPIATALYNMTLDGDWHPIMGNAVVGKWVLTDDGPILDYLDEEDYKQVNRFICDAVDMLTVRSEFKS